jgi:hypothetical protein
MSGEGLGCHKWSQVGGDGNGRGSGMQRVEAKKAVAHPVMHRVTPPMFWPRMSIVLRLKNLSLNSRNVSSFLFIKRICSLQ